MCVILLCLRNVRSIPRSYGEYATVAMAQGSFRSVMTASSLCMTVNRYPLVYMCVFSYAL
jgi:hypothetical protein